MSLKVGDTIWIRLYDVRRYVTGSHSNQATGKDHFEPYVIVGETARSWITGAGWNETKWPKKGGDYLTTPEELALAIWHFDNDYKLKEFVRRINDPAVLLQVAKLVGYSPLLAQATTERETQ